MPRAELLNEFELERLIPTELLGWHREGKTIVLELGTASFASAVGIINAIAVVAESLDHHPDILLYGWNKLRITCTTHESDGLTMLDIQLAKRIDGLGFRL